MATQAKDSTTEERILTAAKKVFIEKGMAGARMQEIADEARINKALLHYYFRNKALLFETVFSQAVQQLFPRLNNIFESDMPLFEKIEHFVESYMDVILENPYLPLFLFNEMHRNPDIFYKKIRKKLNLPHPEKFLLQIEAEAKKGNIRKISPLQLLMNIVSGTIFPFIAKPFFQMHLGLDEFQFRQFLLQRRKEYASFIIDAIKK